MNKEKIIKYMREWRKNNKEKIKDYAKKYRERNYESLKKKNKERYEKYMKNNKEFKEYQKLWKEKNNGRYKGKYNGKYKKSNNGKYNKQALENQNKQRFGGNKEKILLRDKFKCMICNMSNEEHKRKFNCNLSIDHIDGNGRNSKRPNNNLENLRTLCLSCHGKEDLRRRKWRPLRKIISSKREVKKE